MAIEIRHSGETVTVETKKQNVDVLSQPWSVEAVSGVLVGGVPYDGPYEVVPSEVEQTIGTEGLMMRENMTVGAIPSNYGRIAWDGTAITVY